MSERQVLMKLEIFNDAVDAKKYLFEVEVEGKSFKGSIILDRLIADESGFLCDYDARVESFEFVDDETGDHLSLTTEENEFFRTTFLDTANEFESANGFATFQKFELTCNLREIQRLL